jgi:ATP-binding protein involved in chromosome partitioning
MRVFGEFDNSSEGGAQAALAEELERIKANLAETRAIIAVASAKGGVGKSVITVSIASTLALEGHKVGIVDADFNSPSILPMLGIKPPRRPAPGEGIEVLGGPHGLRVVASDLIPGGERPPISFLDDDNPPTNDNAPRPVEMSQAKALRWVLGQARFGPLDVMIVDLPPGLDRLAVLAKTVDLDAVLLVSNPSAHAAHAARHALRLASAMAFPMLGIVENMAGFNCDGCRSVRPLWPEGELAGIAREAQSTVLARLPFDPRVAEASDRGVLFIREYPDTPIAKSLAEIAHHLGAIVTVRARDSRAAEVS